MGIQWPFNPDSWWTLQFARDKVPYVHFALGLFAVVWFVTYLIEDSRWGYWWRAVKDDAQRPRASASRSSLQDGGGGGLGLLHRHRRRLLCRLRLHIDPRA